MILTKFILTLMIVTFFSRANAARTVMLGDGPTENIGMAVQKTENGEIFFLLNQNENKNRVEYVFLPGTPLSREAVLIVEGIPKVVLSVYNGEGYGEYDNSNKVTFINKRRWRTTQRTLISDGIIVIERAGMLVDSDGNKYSAQEIKGAVFVFQTQDNHEARLNTATVDFDSLKAGETVNIYGVEVLEDIKRLKALGDPSKPFDKIEQLRISELPYPSVLDIMVSNLKEDLLLPTRQLIELARDILNRSNKEKDVFDILKPYKLGQAAYLKKQKEEERKNLELGLEYIEQGKDFYLEQKEQSERNSRGLNCKPLY